MNPLHVSDGDKQELSDCCGIADEIFLNAVDRVAAMMEIKGYDVDNDKTIREIAKDHPALVAGFMHAISANFSTRAIERSVERVKSSVDNLEQ